MNAIAQLEIDDINRRRDEVLRDITEYKHTLILADVATFGMLFFFLMAFYVADPFHLASFMRERLEQNHVSELLVYILMLALALVLSLTIAKLKRAHYVHKAKYRTGGTVWKVGAALFIITIVGEIYNATGAQQNSQFAKAEASKTFDKLAGQQIVVQASSSTGDLPRLQGKLAEQQRYLQGCKKQCKYHEATIQNLHAQIQAIQSQQAQDSANLNTVTTTAAKTTAENLAKLRDDYLHPMMKFLAEWGVQPRTAMMLIAFIIAASFERAHISASENLRDCYALLESLDSHLLKYRKQLASELEYRTSRPEPIKAKTEAEKPSYNFGMPSPVTALLHGAKISSDDFIGAFNQNVLSGHPSPALKTALDWSAKPATHRAEEQLEIPLSTFSTEMKKRGIPTQDDPVLDRPAPLDRILNVIGAKPELPRPDAGSDGSIPVPSKASEPQSADEKLADPSNFALLQKYISHPRFDEVFVAVATGTTKCSQKQMMKHHSIGGDMPSWVMVILEAWDIVTEPNANKGNIRELKTALSEAEAQSILNQVKAEILGS